MRSFISKLWDSEKNLSRLKPEFKATNTRISQYGLFLGVGVIGPLIFMISGILGLGGLLPSGLFGDIFFFVYLILVMVFTLYSGVFMTSFIFSLIKVVKGQFTFQEAEMFTIYFRAPEMWLEKKNRNQ